MRSNEIRESFLNYFEERGHTRIGSSSLIPKDDPTLLFTNAGMVQFKGVFLGLEERPYSRAVTVQKCMRAGGKHNDLENVGQTARHHTFFEMLGNFSFGDYFKEEAIAWAWEYLTHTLSLSRERLWVTVFRDDEEAYRIWHRKIGLPAERIVRLGEESNFWMMGETGPCGPCSEIIFDQGPEVGCRRPECHVACDCDRYLEVWNLVFTQFDRDARGNLTPLPKPNIDTGMGLERLAAIVQGRKSNYDTDLFREIISFLERISKKTYGVHGDDDFSFRVIADHSRAITFLIADGVLPANEGRGYVLRRIIRRAARHGKLLGLEEPFLHEISHVVRGVMEEAYPELADKGTYISKVVESEERRFMETLDSGLKVLAEEVENLKNQGIKVIPGNMVFKLYDTYGFPVDLTADIVRKEGFSIDEATFHEAMAMQRERARESWKGSGEEEIAQAYRKISSRGINSIFIGYEGITEGKSIVLALLKNGEETEEIHAGEKGEVICAQTPFYGERGGQVGDRGIITGQGETLFEVEETKHPIKDLTVHIGKLKAGKLKVGDEVYLRVNKEERRAIQANHSATHILQRAIRDILGDHIKQAGSLVEPRRLRFDFTHFASLSPEELKQIEERANEIILMDLPVRTEILPIKEALNRGATAVFDERYEDIVRVVCIGEVSKELCGGTHVNHTGEIGLLKIVHESSVAAGIRRIEAITGRESLRFLQKIEEELKNAANLLKSPPLDTVDRLEKNLKYQRELEKEVERLKGVISNFQSDKLIEKTVELKGIRVLTAIVDARDAKSLRELGDKLRDKLRSGIILLGSKMDGKAMLLCLVTGDLTNRYHAGMLIKEIAPLVGGSGGGRADMAQAGGPHGEKLEQALSSIKEIILHKN